VCRTYGAPDFLWDFSRAFRPGLTYSAPAALVWGACTLARPGNGFAAGHDVARTDASIAESGLVERYYQLYGQHR